MLRWQSAGSRRVGKAQSGAALALSRNAVARCLGATWGLGGALQSAAAVQQGTAWLSVGGVRLGLARALSRPTEPRCGKARLCGSRLRYGMAGLCSGEVTCVLALCGPGDAMP